HMYADPADPNELMDQLGIRSFADRSIRRLSGGQKQRVGLAAALIGKPSLVFLDEPTAGLDPQASLTVKEIVPRQRL
ncbi:ATP-binding cassette domain-containing protein, partial [Brevibacterium paucivorans]|uniref:ATP-binding cassette domain-containing protein n=1 Tax=Brevibacterium paucivorans TaxID=170994 RepID=UPI0035710F69